MKRLAKILIGLALVWTAYWHVAGWGLRSGIANWFAAQQQRGWQADHGGLATSGYPFRHINMLTGPALADPATGTAWQADWLMIESPAVWPGYQTLRFPPSPQRLSHFDATWVVAAQDATADLRLHPGIALEVERLALRTGPWEIAADDGEVTGGGPLNLAMDQTGRRETYRLTVDAAGFTPGGGLRLLVPAGAALPAGFDALRIDAEVTFDRVWDRRALEDRRPQPVAIDLALVNMRWGEMELAAAGEVAVDAQGIPTGSLTVKAEHWREMLAMVQSAWGVPTGAADTLEQALNLVARMGGNPDYLDVSLRFQDGGMSVGPIPLGPAPRIFLR